MSFKKVVTPTLYLCVAMLCLAGITSCSDKDKTHTVDDVATIDNGIVEDAPLVWADRTYMDAVISEAEKINADDYTSASYSQFVKVYGETLAVETDTLAEQETLDAAAAKLEAAIEILEKKADLSEIHALKARIDRMDKSLYTPSSLEHFTKNVDSIMAGVKDDISQKAADTLVNSLKSAIGNLVAIPLDTGKKGSYVNCSAFPVRADGKEFEMSAETEKEFRRIATSRFGFGYFVLDLQTGANLTYNADTEFFQASTAKAQFCLFMYNLIDKGEASFDDELVFQKKHASVGSGEIKETPYGSVYKLDYLIEKALTISDNCAFHMMVDGYDYRKYNAFIKSLGCKYAGEVEPGAHFGYSSPRDTIKIWSEIYTYTRYGANGTQFRRHLENSAYNSVGDGIPEYSVAHKSGWTSAQFNDFAIVYAPHPYLIVTYLTVKDGSERKIVENFSAATKKVMDEYHAFMYENEDIYLPEAPVPEELAEESQDKSNN